MAILSLVLPPLLRLFIFFCIILCYGNEDKDCVVLHVLWQREFQMDGTVPCVQGVEYDG